MTENPADLLVCTTCRATYPADTDHQCDELHPCLRCGEKLYYNQHHDCVLPADVLYCSTCNRTYPTDTTHDCICAICGSNTFGSISHICGPGPSYEVAAIIAPAQKTKRLSLAHEMADAATWSRGVFTKSGIPHYTSQLVEEASEVAENPSDASEIADVLIVIAGLADLVGVNLALAVRDKMDINRTRKFGPDGNRLLTCEGCGETYGKKEVHHCSAGGQHSYIPWQRVKQDKTILQEAQGLVDGQRRTDYGSISASFSRIAKLWSAILDIEVTPEAVGLMMIALKVARATQGFQRDSLVDIAGYAYCIEQIQNEVKRHG